MSRNSLVVVLLVLVAMSGCARPGDQPGEPAPVHPETAAAECQPPGSGAQPARGARRGTLVEQALRPVQAPAAARLPSASVSGDPGRGWHVQSAIELSGCPVSGLWDVSADETAYVVLECVEGCEPDEAVLVAADMKLGDVLWALRVDDRLELQRVLRVPEGPLLLCGSQVVALDPATGAVLYRTDVNPLDRDWGATGAWALCPRGLLYLGAQNLLLLDPITGGELWRVDLGGTGYQKTYSAPAVTADAAYVISDGPDGVERHLWAVDLASGDVAWHRAVGSILSFEDQLETWLGGCAATAEAVACLHYTTTYWYRDAPGDPTPVLRCFSADSGDELWSRPLPSLPDGWGGEIAPPLAAGGLVFVGLRDTEAAAFGMADGTDLGRASALPVGELTGRIACPIRAGTRAGLTLLSPHNLTRLGEIVVGLAQGPNDYWASVSLKDDRLVAIGRNRPEYQKSETVIIVAAP